MKFVRIRFNVRSLIVLVAIAASIIFCEKMRQRRGRYLSLASRFAAEEKSWSSIADKSIEIATLEKESIKLRRRVKLSYRITQRGSLANTPFPPAAIGKLFWREP